MRNIIISMSWKTLGVKHDTIHSHATLKNAFASEAHFLKKKKIKIPDSKCDRVQERGEGEGPGEGVRRENGGGGERGTPTPPYLPPPPPPAPHVLETGQPPSQTPCHRPRLPPAVFIYCLASSIRLWQRSVISSSRGCFAALVSPLRLAFQTPTRRSCCKGVAVST